MGIGQNAVTDPVEADAFPVVCMTSGDQRADRPTKGLQGIAS
jgi:hypothetical protein